MYRHGDLLLAPARAPTSRQPDCASAPGERLVLLEGEATGHAHVLSGLAVAVREGTRALVHLLEPGRITHEEHAEIAVPPGWYEVIQQRVYTPIAPVRVRD